jgi:hypothetical protein
MSVETQTSHDSICKCGKGKRPSSPQCYRCTNNEKGLARYHANAEKKGIIRNEHGNCSACGVQCYGKTGLCKPCNQKRWQRIIMEQRKEKRANATAERQAIRDRIKREQTESQPRRSPEPVSIEDQQFIEGLTRSLRAGDQAWRCNCCGTKILPEYTRCVRCDLVSLAPKRHQAKQSDSFSTTLST